MRKIVRRIASLALYFVAVYAIFVPSLLSIIVIDNTIGFSFNLNGFVEAPLLIITIGTAVLWPLNYFIVWAEHLVKPKLGDHFQLSALYYLLSIYLATIFPVTGFYGGLTETYMLMTLAISVWAIIINAIFLYRRRKLNIA
ncbi:MAG: hypothetical protein OEY44_04490 [Candidatus Peregrinibacteria bacterium]|nr:hypothetical protein [Candidatus Peregrinibacteria bacterium]